MKRRRPLEGAKENRQALAFRRPSVVFWRAESENKGSTVASRQKSSSGATTSTKVKIQAVDDLSKENRVLSVNRNTHQRRPSLKELCPEDKARVKLLIEQLAQTSTEKEAMEDQMKEERKQFTMLLGKLKEQHHKVVQEKKELESELHASQLQLQTVHTYPPTSTTSHPPSSTAYHPSSSTASHPPSSTTSHPPSSTMNHLPLSQSPMKPVNPPHHLTLTRLTADPVTSTEPYLHFPLVRSADDSVTSSFHYPPFQEPATNTSTLCSQCANQTTSDDLHLHHTSANSVMSSVLRQIPQNMSTCTEFAKSSQRLPTRSVHPSSPLNCTTSTLSSRCEHALHPKTAPTDSTTPYVQAYYPEYFPTSSTNRTRCASSTIASSVDRCGRKPSMICESQCVKASDYAAAQRCAGHGSSLLESSVRGIHVEESSLIHPSSLAMTLSSAVDGKDIQQRSTIYPQSLTDSFSTTSVSQGAPLSSTRVQVSHQECQAGASLTLKGYDDSTSAPSLSERSHMTSNNIALTSGDNTTMTSDQTPANLPQAVSVTGDPTSHVGVAEMTSSPEQAAARPWLSLPSATPDKTCSHDERKRKEVVFHEEPGEGSRREIGTQTLCVESVSTQTDNKDEQKVTDPVMKETMAVSSNSSAPTKTGSVDPAAVSVRDKLTSSAITDNNPQIQSPSKQFFTPSQKDNDRSENDYSTREFSGDEVLLMEELLSTSELLNGLSGRLGLSQRCTHLEKRAQSSALEPLSPLELAASLNSQNNTFTLGALDDQLQRHSRKEHVSVSMSLGESLNTTTPNSPQHARLMCDSERESLRSNSDSGKVCLDESDLIEELFFI